MNLLKEEKKFWLHHFRIENLEAIPPNWNTYKSIDSEIDDNFFYFLSLRVKSILEIHLKATLVTDEGIRHISNFKDLEILYLRKHNQITRNCIPHINNIESLKSLNITKTNITLTDLCENLNNQNLKDVFLDSEENEESILEMGLILKERMPGCNIYLNTSFKTDVHENRINPIF